MVEPRNDEMLRRTEDTTNPKNPPNSMLSKSARRAAVGSYFVPIVVLFLVIGAALVYWSRRPAHSDTDRGERSAIGTIGSTEGGNDARPKLDSPRDEIQFRAGDLAPITTTADLRDVKPRTMAGRRVEIGDAKVDSVNGNTLWVRDDDRKYAIMAPAGTGSVKPGTKVSISGRVEPDNNGDTRIVADRVQVK
jgi:hypothetical protein